MMLFKVQSQNENIMAFSLHDNSSSPLLDSPHHSALPCTASEPLECVPKYDLSLLSVVHDKDVYHIVMWPLDSFHRGFSQNKAAISPSTHQSGRSNEPKNWKQYIGSGCNKCKK